MSFVFCVCLLDDLNGFLIDISNHMLSAHFFLVQQDYVLPLFSKS